MSLLQLMVSVNYYGVTATASGAHCTPVSVAVAVLISKAIYCNRDNFFAPVPVAVVDRQFGRKIHLTLPQYQQKCQNKRKIN